MIVVIEGMDFTGKTTVCAQTAALLTAQGIRVRQSTTSLTGGVMPSLIEAVYLAPQIPDRLRSFVFHAAYMPDLVRARQRRAEVVMLQESYVCRVWAYDHARSRRWLALVAQWLAERLHQRVDVAVLLRCPYEQRRQRYLASGVVWDRDEHRFAPSQITAQQELEAALFRTTSAHGYKVIDTGGRTAEQVAQEITDLVLEARTQELA